LCPPAQPGAARGARREVQCVGSAAALLPPGGRRCAPRPSGARVLYAGAERVLRWAGGLCFDLVLSPGTLRVAGRLKCCQCSKNERCLKVTSFANQRRSVPLMGLRREESPAWEGRRADPRLPSPSSGVGL